MNAWRSAPGRSQLEAEREGVDDDEVTVTNGVVREG